MLKSSLAIIALLSFSNIFGQEIKQLSKAQINQLESRMIDATSTQKITDSLHLAYLIEHFYFYTENDAVGQLEKYYRKAYEQDPGCNICKLKADNLSAGKHDHLEEASYSKLIEAADTKFGLGEYEAAKEIYARALSIKPSDTYAAEQIATIESLIYSENNKKLKKSKKVPVNKNMENQNQAPEQKL